MALLAAILILCWMASVCFFLVHIARTRAYTNIHTLVRTHTQTQTRAHYIHRHKHDVSVYITDEKYTCKMCEVENRQADSISTVVTQAGQATATKHVYMCMHNFHTHIIVRVSVFSFNLCIDSNYLCAEKRYTTTESVLLARHFSMAKPIVGKEKENLRFALLAAVAYSVNYNGPPNRQIYKLVLFRRWDHHNAVLLDDFLLLHQLAQYNDMKYISCYIDITILHCTLYVVAW